MKAFTIRSLEKFKGVHPLLVKCAQMALERSTVDFQISEGVRSLERQQALYEAKKSRTMKSYHLEGKAIDVFALVNNEVSWLLSDYKKINEAFQSAAKELGIKVTWGGVWKSIVDGPHFQIEV
jgi:peptidoglycan L-alanyl-D-glutamate endopeptidase CwlK